MADGATVALTLGSPAWPEAAAIEASLPQGSLVAGELLAGLDVGVAATSTGSILLCSLAAEPFLIRFPLGAVTTVMACSRTARRRCRWSTRSGVR